MLIVHGRAGSCKEAMAFVITDIVVKIRLICIIFYI